MERYAHLSPRGVESAAASASRLPLAWPGGAAAAQLSPREVEVLQRSAAGDTNKHIARAFGLSPHTVKRHVANILTKLRADNRMRAAARWREGHLPRNSPCDSST